MYNSEKYIGNTIKSVINQTYKNWELIIVDDCSTDRSISIVKKYVGQDKRINLIKTKRNFGGPARARNIGINLSKGNHIAFLDSDDIWFKNKLDICMKNFHSEVDLLFHDFKKFGKVSFFEKKIIRGKKLNSPITKNLLLKDNVIINSSVIVRKELIEKVGFISEENSMIAAEDYNLWLKISTVTENFLYIPKVLGKYFIGENNISNKDMSLCRKMACKNFENKLSKSEIQIYNAIFNYMRGKFLYSKGKYIEAQKYFKKNLGSKNINISIKSFIMLFVSNLSEILISNKTQ